MRHLSIVFIFLSFFGYGQSSLRFQETVHRFGELNEKYKDMPEINGLELFTVIPLAIITLFFGIYPGPYLDIIKATMDQIIEKIAFVATYASM